MSLKPLSLPTPMSFLWKQPPHNPMPAWEYQAINSTPHTTQPTSATPPPPLSISSNRLCPIMSCQFPLFYCQTIDSKLPLTFTQVPCTYIRQLLLEPTPNSAYKLFSTGPTRPDTMVHYPLFTSHQIPMPAGQLRAAGWKAVTTGYPDPKIIMTILGICKFGARIE